MIRKAGLIVTLLLAMIGTSAFAQTVVPRIIHYRINAEYKMRVGDYILPAGNYVLEQAMQSDPDQYYLRPADLTREPIAIIRTAHISYSGQMRQPERTKMLIEFDEESTAGTMPVLKGWVLPGEDGWEIISVVPKKNSPLVRVNY